MIPLQEVLIKYGIEPKGVLQVGAHFAEENEEFEKIGIPNIVYIEPCKSAYKHLVEKLSIYPYDFVGNNEYVSFGSSKMGSNEIKMVSLLNFACADYDGESAMYVSHQNEGQSNSLLNPMLHKEQHPEVIFDDAEVVKVSTLDNLMDKYIYYITPIDKRDRHNILMIDVQGAEGLVLKGATETLKHIDLIYTEINRDYTYENNMLIGEMEEFLKPYGFELVEQYWPSPNWSWGDGVFIKKNKNEKK